MRRAALGGLRKHRMAALGLLAALLTATLCAVPTAADPLGQITEYSAGLGSGSSPGGIVAGADGNLWFDDPGSTPAIGRISPSGQITEYASGLKAGSSPGGISSTSIADGPDGNVWFTDMGTTKAIGRITPTGQISEYSSGLIAGGGPQGIAAGPDGNVWFTTTGVASIGRITTAGTITQYTAGLGPHSSPQEIARGADGDLWFTDLGCESGGTCAIGRVTRSGHITEYSAGLGGGIPEGIAAGPDGNMWFTDSKTPAIGRITPAGAITEYTGGLGAGAFPTGIAAGPDDSVWFADAGKSPAIGRITLSGQITEYASGLGAGSAPFGIALGPDHNLWFTDEGTVSAIGRIGSGVSSATTVGPPAGGSLYAGTGKLTGGFSGGGTKVTIKKSGSFRFCLRVAHDGQVTPPSVWAIGLTKISAKLPGKAKADGVFDASGFMSGTYRPGSRHVFLAGTEQGAITVKIKGLGKINEPLDYKLTAALPVRHPTVNSFTGDIALSVRQAQRKATFKSTEHARYTARRVTRCAVATPPSLG